MIVQADANEYLPTLRSESVDLIVTDPPYGTGYRSNFQGVDRRHRNATQEVRVVRSLFFDSIQGDAEVPTAWLTQAHRVLKDNSAMYIFCHWTRWHTLYTAVLATGFTVKNMIILNKSNHGMGDLNGQYAPKHELLLFATKGRHLLSRANGRGKDVWDVPVRFSGARRRHPNEKPESWIEPCVVNSSEEGDLVLDPFAGSGTTGVVCKRLQRRFLLVEIEESYCSESQRRTA